MSYAPKTDFLALLRDTGSGLRLARMPGLDYLAAALARAGLINLWTSPSAAPSSNQSTTAWLKTSATSWASEGTLYLWDAAAQAYRPATAANFAAMILAAAPTSALSEVDLEADEVLTAAQAFNDTLYTNAGGTIALTLPSIQAGMRFQFAVVQPGTFSIISPNNVPIRWGGVQEYNSISSDVVGSFMRLRAVYGSWTVTAGQGNWTLA